MTIYKQQGCPIAQAQRPVTLVDRKVTVITITPTSTCQQLDIPNNALIYDDVNYYQTQITGTKQKTGASGPMTIWVDTETSIVLRAQRTTTNNLPWDRYAVTSLAYSPKIPEHLLNYTPPPGMIVVTNP